MRWRGCGFSYTIAKSFFIFILHQEVFCWTRSSKSALLNWLNPAWLPIYFGKFHRNIYGLFEFAVFRSVIVPALSPDIILSTRFVPFNVFEDKFVECPQEVMPFILLTAFCIWRNIVIHLRCFWLWVIAVKGGIFNVRKTWNGSGIALKAVQ